MADFHISKRSDEQFGWRAKSANGQIIAFGGAGFSSNQVTRTSIAAVKRTATAAEAVDNDW